jgi:hypothetical protein
MWWICVQKVEAQVGFNETAGFDSICYSDVHSTGLLVSPSTQASRSGFSSSAWDHNTQWLLSYFLTVSCGQ